MRIAVEEAVLEDHLHPRLAHAVCDAPALFEGVRLWIDVRDLRALEELEGKDAFARVAPVNARDLHVRIPRPVPAEALGVPPFGSVVELRADRAAELVDELARIDEVERPDSLLRDAGRLVEQREIRVDLARRTRALHLDGDGLSIRQRRAVPLSDRGCGDRLPVEGDERPLERQAE